jgi:hypothetical protein
MCRRNQAPSPELDSKLVDALTRELISHGMLFAYDRPLRARTGRSITAHCGSGPQTASLPNFQRPSLDGYVRLKSEESRNYYWASVPECGHARMHDGDTCSTALGDDFNQPCWRDVVRLHDVLTHFRKVVLILDQVGEQFH